MCCSMWTKRSNSYVWLDVVCRKKQQDIFNASGSMFTAIIFLGFSNAVSVQPVVDAERTVFYREKAAGMSPALPYATAQVTIFNFFG